MRGLFFISALALLSACQSQDEAEIVPNFEAVTQASITPPTPGLPAGRLEDINFSDYSIDLANPVGLKMGESRLESIDKIRLYFAPENGANIVKTTSSTFERDDGSVMIFASHGMQDDSVKAEEVYAVFSGPNGPDKFNQSLAAYGMRIKCHRGENTTKWQTSVCP